MYARRVSHPEAAFAIDERRAMAGVDVVSLGVAGRGLFDDGGERIAGGLAQDACVQREHPDAIGTIKDLEGACSQNRMGGGGLSQSMNEPPAGARASRLVTTFSSASQVKLVTNSPPPAFRNPRSPARST